MFILMLNTTLLRHRPPPQKIAVGMKIKEIIQIWSVMKIEKKSLNQNLLRTKILKITFIL